MTNQLVSAPEGVAAGLTYFVSYDEDLWHAFDKDRQEFCKADWISRASATDGVRFVVLKLIPDPIFPSYGHDKPYVHWQHEIEQADDDAFSVTATVKVVVNQRTKFLDPALRADITSALQRFPIGTKYTVVNTDNDLLEHGVR